LRISGSGLARTGVGARLPGTGRRWRVRYADPDGQERNRSFDRKADADKFRAQVEADVLRGTYLDPDAGKITLRRYAEGWIRGFHADSARRAKIRSHLDIHILPVLGSRTLGQLAASPTSITQWLTGLPLSASTAGQVLVTLSSVLSAAVDDRRIGQNPCKLKSVRAPKQSRQRVVPWTGAEVAAVRAGLPERFAVMTDCGAGLGLRQGEIFGLGPDEIDFLRRVVHVRRQVKRLGGRVWFAPPKGGREHDVPLAAAVSLALAAQIAAHPPQPVTLLWNDPGQRQHRQPVTASLMFVTATRAPLISSTFNAMVWNPAVTAAGVSHGNRRDGMHALRHFYASVLLSGGVDIRALSEYLGHHDPAFTLRIYAHLMPDTEGKALRAVENALSAHDHPQSDGAETAREGENPR
jgi:integrase